MAWSDPGRESRATRRPASPSRHRGLVKLVAFADVDVARVLALAGAGRDRSQRRAAEESHLGRSGVKVWSPRNQPWPRCRTTASSTSRLAHPGDVRTMIASRRLPRSTLPAWHPGDCRPAPGRRRPPSRSEGAAREDSDLRAFSRLDRLGLRRSSCLAAGLCAPLATRRTLGLLRALLDALHIAVIPQLPAHGARPSA